MATPKWYAKKLKEAKEILQKKCSITPVAAVTDDENYMEQLTAHSWRDGKPVVEHMLIHVRKFLGEVTASIHQLTFYGSTEGEQQEQ